MPAIIELRLRPDRLVQPTTRQLHGLACALFEGASDAGHEGQEKPFSVWPLRKAPGGWLLRTAWLLPGFPQGVLASCGQVRLGPAVCTVTDLALRPVTHAELACVPAIDGIRLTLLSPAYFSRNGTHAADADPRLIVGSWRRRWNASLPSGSGLAVDAQLWRDIHLALHVSGSGLHTEIGDTGYHPQAGLVGTVTMRLETGASPEVRQAFGALARFGEYCGTGAQVTHGFGATKVTLLRSSWSADTEHAPMADHGSIPERRER